jgi:hypothetical protein
VVRLKRGRGTEKKQEETERLEGERLRERDKGKDKKQARGERS